MIFLFNNASWPAGKWKIEYIRENDYYQIKTEYGIIIANVYSTLVAHWLVEFYNSFF